MSFSDIFKSDFLENATSISVTDMLIALGLAFLIGVFISFIYKKTYKGVMYSSSFGVSLLALTLITTLVILAVTSNVVLSLGMVGALSIVRFRTAIKEPLDIAFLFWAIAVGIILGAGFISLAIIGSLILGIILYFYANAKQTGNAYILVLNMDNAETEAKVNKYLSKTLKKYLLKSKTISKDNIELIAEVRLTDKSAAFANALNNVNGVKSAVLTSYSGEFGD